MTENEKKLLQAKRRLEQAQNRSRDKERKARTRRLIQEGAILEKVLPNITSVALDDLERYLQVIYGSNIYTGRSEGSGRPFSIPEGRTYTPPINRR